MKQQSYHSYYHRDIIIVRIAQSSSQEDGLLSIFRNISVLLFPSGETKQNRLWKKPGSPVVPARAPGRSSSRLLRNERGKKQMEFYKIWTR